MFSAGEVDRIPIKFGTDFIYFIDDGDGIFHNDNPNDGLELEDGTRIREIHPRAMAILKKLDIATFHGKPIVPLSYFCLRYEELLPAMKKAKKVSDLMMPYIELRNAALEAGIQMEPWPSESGDGHFYKRIQAAIGGMECYLFIGYAQRFINNGSVEGAIQYLARAEACATHHDIPKKKIAPVIDKLMEAGRKKEIDIILVRTENFLEKPDSSWEGIVRVITTNTKKAEELAKKYGLSSFAADRIDALRTTICKLEVNTRMGRIESAAKRASFDAIPNDIAELLALPDTEDPSLSKTYKKIIESDESNARMKAIGEALNQGVTAKIEGLLAQARSYASSGMIDRVEEKLVEAENLAKGIKQVEEYSESISEIRKKAYLTETLRILKHLETNFTRLDKGYMQEKVKQVEAIAKKGGIERNASFKKQLRIVKDLIKRL